MTSEKGKFGDINVQMGNGNYVEHIGHKITFHAPPPSPKSLFQDKHLAGVFEGEPSLQPDGRYRSPKLFVSPGFDERKEFVIQGVRLLIEQSGFEGSISLAGRPPLRTFWGAVCRILK